MYYITESITLKLDLTYITDINISLQWIIIKFITEQHFLVHLLCNVLSGNT